jgi:hypothetical protein
MSAEFPPQYQKVVRPNLEHAAPKALSSQFIRIKYDLAKVVQALPEMTYDELLKANALAGGFSWMEDPSEELYG